MRAAKQAEFLKSDAWFLEVARFLLFNGFCNVVNREDKQREAYKTKLKKVIKQETLSVQQSVIVCCRRWG